MARRTTLLLLQNVQLCSLDPDTANAESSQSCILVAGSQVAALLGDEDAAALAAAVPGVEELECGGLLAVPGFVDCHVHVCGGGGEAGPASRTPEARLSELLRAGITTVVGVTGTDSVTRSQEALVAKVRALGQEGITAFHWCGSYRLPPATATGSVQRDLVLLPSCLGVGEVAVSDHRGSAPEPRQLLQLALEARVGGLLGGKPGIVHCHLGPGRAGLDPLRAALELGGGDLPITAFHPTHVERSPQLVEQGAAWLADGGSLDLTAGSPACLAALRGYRQAGLPLAAVTVSSDAYGSLPVFDEGGRLVRMDVAEPDSLLHLLRALVLDDGWPLGEALPLVSRNPAQRLGLRGKGRLAVGYDADVLLMDPDILALQYVLARGKLVKTPGWVRGGMFERGPGIRPFTPTLQTG